MNLHYLDDGSIKLDQHRYIKEILHELQMENAKPDAIPARLVAFTGGRSSIQNGSWQTPSCRSTDTTGYCICTICRLFWPTTPDQATLGSPQKGLSLPNQDFSFMVVASPSLVPGAMPISDLMQLTASPGRDTSSHWGNAS